jgi:hypothetical protein
MTERLNVTTHVIDLPDRLRLDSLGYGSAVIGLPARGGALISALAGSAVRCLWIDPSGRVDLIPKVRGLLRDACVEPDGSVWLLTTHALQLVDLDARAVVATITARLPKYARHLCRFDADHLLVSNRAGQTVAVVSVRARAVERTVRVPAVDIVMPGPPALLCSFEHGMVRPVRNDLSRAGADRSVPLGMTPVRTPSGIALVLASFEPIVVGSTVVVPDSGPVVALLDADFAVRTRREVAGLERLDGLTADGQLLGVTPSKVVLLDALTLAESARVDVGGAEPAVGAIGPGRAISLVDRAPAKPLVQVLQWSPGAWLH